MRHQQPSFMVSSGGIELAVYTAGTAPKIGEDKPVLLFAQGFPDRAFFWDRIVALLQDQCFIITFDLRGTGQSTPVKGVKPYHYDALVNDVYAVIEAMSPHHPVQLVGHDWGGIYGWEVCQDQRAIGRIKTFYTLSPSLDQIGLWMRRRLLKPTPKHLYQLFSQLFRNSLMLFFALPLLPVLLWRSSLAAKMMGYLYRKFEGLTFEPYDSLQQDAISFLGIYRANLLRKVLMPKPKPCLVPVHALIAQRDPFLPPWTFEVAPDWAADYRQTYIDASHWAPLSQSKRIAELIEQGFTPPQSQD